MRTVPFVRAGIVAAALAVAASVAACAPQKAATTAPTPSGSATLACSPASMATLTPGKLTMGTDNPVYEPWFTDNKPENGQGFEGAVAAAVAAKLGYQPGDVVWTRVTFNNAIAPGPKKYDFDINEF